ncbi:MAG: HlyD family efflux transporter periplasmic adaptor subunit [Ginsengibacter sp.]
MKKIATILLPIIFLISCENKKNVFDASGTFEAVETIISAEASGKILQFNVEEGQHLSKDSIVGYIDPVNIELQKEQVTSSINALQKKTLDVAPQVKLLQSQLAVQKSQLQNVQHERNRIENLLRKDAATPKQMDDITAQVDVLLKQIDVTQQQINVQENNISTQNRSIMSESGPLQKRAEQLQYQADKTKIINPVQGVVLSKYAEQYEMTAPGKPLYKIADLSTIILRAYITGDQFAGMKLNQNVKVQVDDGKNNYRQYPGMVEWISDKAEFTPKTIQTKDERANLVYAIKIKVKNDGYLKIGMYGEVLFN